MSENGEVAVQMAQMRYLKNVEEVLPEFDPVKKNINITRWIEIVDESSVIYGWTDLEVRHYALTRMVGVAKKWRESLKPQPASWNSWKAKLKETFPGGQSLMTIRLEAQNYKRKPQQEVTEYVYEKLALCNKAEMSEEETKEWMVSGLGNDRYRDHLGPLIRYQSLFSLIEAISDASRYIKDERRTSSDAKKSIQCHKCKKMGHFARECTDGSGSQPPKIEKRTVTCFKCKQVGHYARDCSSTASASSSASKPMLVINDRSANTKYFKNAIVNGVEVRSYVDLGSQSCAIRQDVADGIGLVYEPSEDHNPLNGYGGGVVQPIGIGNTTVEIDNVRAKVNIHVVPNDVQEIPFIVGHPYTEQSHVIIFKTATEFRISSNGLGEFDGLESPTTSRTPVWATDAAVIPNNFLGHVSVRTNLKNASVCIEGGIRECGEMVPRCIVKTSGEGEAIVPMLNITGKDLPIEGGALIARGDLCVEGQYEREKNTEPVTIDEVDTDLTGEEAQSLVNVLNNHKGLISRNLRQVGRTSMAEMKIELQDDKPVFYQPYRLSHSEREQVRNIVQDLQEADIVEPSDSPFASPVLLVKKSNGDVRMCVDYRALNKKTIKMHYPIPRIDDQLDRLGGKKYFTTLDLSSGYYQVPVAEESREKTTFITCDGTYRFKTMPFGLCNAPAVFQRLINTVLSNLRFDTALAYLDDVIIPSVTVEEGLRKLCLVLERFKHANLTLNLSKCHFLKTKIDYLGFNISAEGIEPGQRKVRAVAEFPVPANVHKVRSFLGLANYFRRFVKGFASVAKPLTDLLRKDTKFVWGEQQNVAFNTLKQMLICKPILAVYNPDAPTEIHTDASAEGLGSVLLQQQLDKSWRPVSYYSRKTTPEESRYHSYELECLSIVAALERFRVYLLGRPFVIKTDCNSVKLLAGKRDLVPRIGRWFVKLSEFQYTIEHLKAEQNRVADSLSRNPVEECVEIAITGLGEGLHVGGIKINTDWVAALQRDCQETQAVLSKLENGDQATYSKFTIYKGRVYRVKNGCWRLYVPKDLRSEIVIEAHRELAHLGIDKTLAKIKESYYFPKMRDFVTNYVNRCINCLYYKTPRGKRPGYLHPLDKGQVPFQVVHIDHLGPFIESKSGNKFVTALIDGYSKYCVIKAVPDVGADSTLLFLREFIMHYGKPDRWISDRGTGLIATAIEKFSADLGIEHVRVATGTPRANGQVEKLNDMLIACMSTCTEELDGADWEEKLPEVQWAINNTEHSVTKRTPFSLVFKNNRDGFQANPLAKEIEDVNREMRVGNEVEDTDAEVTERLESNRSKMSKQFNKSRRPAPNYRPGQLVLVRSETAATGQSRKLMPKYRGPYEVVKVLGNDRYLIQDIAGEQQSSRIYKGILSVDRLKLVSPSGASMDVD